MYSSTKISGVLGLSFKTLVLVVWDLRLRVQNVGFEPRGRMLSSFSM